MEERGFSRRVAKRAQTVSAKSERLSARLSRASDAYARQVTTLGGELDVHVELDARLALDEDLRPRTRRSPRPAGARLEARLLASWSSAKVDFIRSCAGQGHMRTVLVVPLSKLGQLTLERSAQQRDHGNRRRPSNFSVLMKRSTTAMLPCLPMAPMR